jgi:hypothetical protein
MMGMRCRTTALASTSTWSKLAGGLVGQRSQRIEHANLVVPIVRDQEIHVHRAAVVPRGADREATDDDVPRAALVQRTTEIPEVLDRRLTRL